MGKDILSKIPDKYYNSLSLLIFIVAVAGAYLGTGPIYKNMNQVSADYQAQKGELKALNEKVENLKKDENDQKTFQDLCAGIEEAIPPNDKPEEVANQVDKIMEDSGLIDVGDSREIVLFSYQADYQYLASTHGMSGSAPTSTGTQDATAKSYFYNGTFRVEEANYYKITNFMDNVGNNKRFLELKEIKLDRERGDAENKDYINVSWVIEAKRF